MTMADQELEEDEEEIEDQPAADGADQGNKGYVGVHTVSFDDMQLKRELTRAIQDCGFEHPSESALQSLAARLLVLAQLLGRDDFAGTSAAATRTVLHTPWRVQSSSSAFQ